ncbi:hypothetical protein GINT2_001626 [Glugoides intestinalis]
MDKIFKEINLIEIETIYMNNFKSTASYTTHAISLFMFLCLLGSCFSSTVYKVYVMLLPFYRASILAYLTFGLLIEGIEYALVSDNKHLNDVFQKVFVAFGLPILLTWGFIECFVGRKMKYNVNLSTVANDIQFFGLFIVTVLFSISFVPYQWSALLLSQALNSNLGYFGVFIAKFFRFVTYCASSFSTVTYIGTLISTLNTFIFRLIFVFVSNNIIRIIYDILYPIRKYVKL